MVRHDGLAIPSVRKRGQLLRRDELRPGRAERPNNGVTDHHDDGDDQVVASLELSAADLRPLGESSEADV